MAITKIQLNLIVTTSAHNMKPMCTCVKWPTDKKNNLSESRSAYGRIKVYYNHVNYMISHIYQYKTIKSSKTIKLLNLE